MRPMRWLIPSCSGTETKPPSRATIEVHRYNDEKAVVRVRGGVGLGLGSL